jgi:dTDP-4-dehydrorhamnose reductase
LGRPAARPAMSALDNTKFSAFTGYKMREWKEALKEYLNKR